ncbi:MAG: metallophosphoesterase, partial [Sedimentisphaerales bacterium]|nr:metallophosphoesterase [Sedimentisphaerales bacterium]
NMSLFFIKFLTIYLLLNIYVIRRTYSLLALKPGKWFYIMLALAGTSFFAARILTARFDNFAVNTLDFLASLWMGVSLLLLICLAVHEVINIPFNISRPKAGFIVTGIAAVLSIYAFINAQLIFVTPVNIIAGFNMKIAHLSDIHLGSTGKGFLERVIKKTNAAKPDIVLITGDLIDNWHYLDDGALEVLNKIEAPVYFSIGNHEQYIGSDDVVQFLRQKTKVVTLLRGDIAEFGPVRIVGIDDSREDIMVKKQLTGIKPDTEKYTILMHHRPEGFFVAANAGVDLMLSGHTHNGQIFPFNYFVRRHHEFMKGLYKYKNCYLYVTPGTGTWGPPMRLGSKNQITIINLN